MNYSLLLFLQQSQPGTSTFDFNNFQIFSVSIVLDCDQQYQKDNQGQWCSRLFRLFFDYDNKDSSGNQRVVFKSRTSDISKANEIEMCYLQILVSSFEKQYK
eukprot:TRINITY_DN63707_c0_g1_i7.p3 TRINITY_DN63707_c0_g1~~TRINITY_DN63707_c0_g1_i7.p3  ORF type:complete len:102 (-),score=7.98 TRINITY_DN63707_c0_g1_i7:85-390(-)